MSHKLTDLVQRTVTRLSMVSGVAVQVYAEDRIAEMIWHKYLMVRDKVWWDDLMDYHVLTQDANGRPIENVVRALPDTPAGDEIVINKFGDIQHAWHPNDRDPLMDSSRRYNPRSMLTTGRTRYIVPDGTTVVRFAPFQSGLQMMVRVRRYYPYFQPDDIVPMDDQLMILGAAYDYLEDDGTNPGQTEKFRNLFNDRLTQLISIENDRAIELSPPTYPDNNGWQVVG